MKYLPDAKRHVQKYALFHSAVAMIWLKTYVTHRFQFELPVSGWYQELILLISPVSSILMMLGLGFILLGHRSYAAVLLMSLVSGLLLLANMVYYRFFNDFITLPVLFQYAQVSHLGGSIEDLLRPSDFLVFADTLILALMSCRGKWRGANVSRISAGLMMALAVTLFSINMWMAEKVRPELLTRTFDRQIVVKNIGVFNYLLYDAVQTASIQTRTVFASGEDLAAVKSFVQAEPEDVKNPRMYGLAKGRNVFLISLESMQSFPIGRTVEGWEITPFLNGLIKNSFYFDQFYHQTGQGKTSDAEFSIDTMLYPLPSGAVFFTHPQNTYFSLPKELKQHGYFPVALHANNKTFWNREQMYNTLGYERFFSVKDYNVNGGNAVGWGLKDIAFFEQSVARLQRVPQPFYAKLITLTNHYPFTLGKEDRLIPELHSGSKTLNRYVETVRYTDEALKHFFALVKAAGLYDNSVFILYGDHYGISKKHRKAMAKFLGEKKLTAFDHIQLQRVPLIIHIPGVKGSTIGTVSGQIDLKPTILHLLGIEPSEREKIGFGHDLFALNKPQFAVLRDGSFITERYVFSGSKCYSRTSGEKLDPAFCEPYREKAQKHLKYSDKVVYGNLLRFLTAQKS